ncbi:MAG: hypothetical protein WDN49_11880 [Acetobacteraceae bacterium]
METMTFSRGISRYQVNPGLGIRDVIKQQLDFKGFAFDGIEGRSCPRFQPAGFGQLEWLRRERPRLADLRA